GRARRPLQSRQRVPLFLSRSSRIVPADDAPAAQRPSAGMQPDLAQARRCAAAPPSVPLPSAVLVHATVPVPQCHRPLAQGTAALRRPLGLARNVPLNLAANSDSGAAADAGARELPSASVVVAIYNAAATLRACVESLLQLDYPRDRFDLVCVDNDSTDASAGILAEYRDRLTVAREPQRGPAAPRNP